MIGSLVGLMLLPPAWGQEQKPGGVRSFMAYAWRGTPGRYQNIVPFYWVSLRNADPVAAKNATDAMPKGHRVLFSWDLHRSIAGDHRDFCRTPAGDRTKQPGIWWDKGAEACARRFDEFFKRYHRIGGKVDTLVLDCEISLGNWRLSNKPVVYQAIQRDPRFAEVGEQLGFSDLNQVRRWRQSDHYLRWNALMHHRVAGYLDKGIFEPIKKYYPNLQASNYGHRYGKPPFACPDLNGHHCDRYPVEGKSHFGTHQSASLYAHVAQLARHRFKGSEMPYGDGAFQGFRHSVNRMRSMALSSDVPIAPWISHKAYKNSDVRLSDLYQELIFHVGLTGPDAFLYWNPIPRGKDARPEHAADDKQDQLVSECLRQLDLMVGGADRKTLVRSLADWSGDFILTGMEAERRVVWRFTPDLPPGAVRNSVLVSQDPPVFQTAQSRIKIPGGRIIRPARTLSWQGFWVTAPVGTQPVIEKRSP